MNSTEKNHRIREGLERSILQGIACEWENALWVLNTEHRRRMRRPLFALGEMKSTLGQWSGEKREICLSRHFVLNHPWDAVREVVVHEMAHQFAEEVLAVTHEPSHGPAFQEACRFLRANPKASGTQLPLQERIKKEPAGPEDKRIRRITKLLALAESRNKNEAEAAMVKAHQLIAKYNVDLLKENESRNFFSIFLGKPALRHPREENHLASLLQDFYFVEGLWVSSYVLGKGKMGRVLEISGRRENLTIAEYVYLFVNRFTDLQWEKYNSGRGLNRYRKTDFAVGILDGFREKLEAQAEKGKAEPRSKALVALEDPLLKKYISHRYPHTVTYSRRISRQDEGVLRDGVRIGRKLVISKGITESRRSRRLLPGNAG